MNSVKPIIGDTGEWLIREGFDPCNLQQMMNDMWACERVLRNFSGSCYSGSNEFCLVPEEIPFRPYR